MNIPTKSLAWVAAPIAFFTPYIAFAQTLSAKIGEFLTLLDQYVVPLIFAISLVVFLWGLFVYLIRGGASTEGQASGKALMLWGLIGFVVMVSVWGIVNLLASSLGLTDTTLKTIPKATVGTGGGTTGTGVSPDCGAAC